MKKPQLKMPSVLGKISAKFGQKPVFNKPVCTEKRYHVARAVYAVFLTLLILVAASIIGLKVMTINFIEDNRDTGFEFVTDEPQGVIMAALPRMLYTTPAKLALVAGAISIFVGVAHLAFVITDWKKGKKTQAYAFRRNVMFLHTVNAILILLALVSLFVTHKSSSHFNVRYITNKADRPSSDDGMRYNRGTFDLERWSCELKTLPGAEVVWSDYGAQCAVEMAGRGLMVAFLVVGCGLVGASVWNMRSGRDAEGERIKTEQVEVEMGKMNAV